MTMFLDTPMLAFDVESTGVDVETDRIVTATAVVADPVAKTAEPTSWLVNPGIEIPAEATAIHGVTTDEARLLGADPAEAIAEIAIQIAEAWEQDMPVVAFNAAYDLTLLAREMRRHGVGELKATGPVIDPMCIDRALDPYRKGKRTLADVCAHYGVTQTDAHSSVGDALAAARLAWKLPRAYKDLRNLDLWELHERQVGWREAWATEFEAYLRRKGEHTKIDGHWPLRPFVEAMAS